MLKRILLIAIISSSGNSYAVTFKQAVAKIGEHSKSKILNSKYVSLIERAKLSGSWGDPVFKASLKNYPKDTLADDQTPMSGVEFMVSQKLPLTTKYGNTKEANTLLAKSLNDDRKQLDRELIAQLWVHAITKRKDLEQEKILRENLAWIDKMLGVSKKLYANGKISQQALFELNIRRSEIEAKIERAKFSIKATDARTMYLYGDTSGLNISSVPWKLLKQNRKSIDPRENSLRRKKAGREMLSKAATQGIVPDLTFSFSYSKRANIDGNGDFVGASVSFPIPLSTKTYAKRRESIAKQSAAESELRNYLSFKESELLSLTADKQSIEKELSILTRKSIGYAKNSRNISSVSYRHGRVGYLELLNSELKLQQLLLKKTKLKLSLAINKVNQKLLRGDVLHEN